MERKVGMVHAGCFNARLFGQLTSEIMPGVAVVHLVDEGLPFMSDEQLRALVLRRLRWLAFFTEESGAEIVMLTCTAFGRLVDEVKAAVSIPVLAVLEIIIEEAMDLSDRIGILGTHPGTLASTAQIIREQAALDGKRVEVQTSLCAGAFDAMMREDWATHDRIVLEQLNRLMEEVEVVLIPQPSMERVLKQVTRTKPRVPVLTSARLSVRRLSARLDDAARSEQS
jgi:aspartate/glutamate racemase